MTDFGFTGQQLDRSTGGLMYYGARYYLPELRRFISADTIVPGATNPQAFNRYAYVLNNPVRYVDPTGHDQWYMPGGYKDRGFGGGRVSPYPKSSGGGGGGDGPITIGGGAVTIGGGGGGDGNGNGGNNEQTDPLVADENGPAVGDSTTSSDGFFNNNVGEGAIEYVDLEIPDWDEVIVDNGASSDQGCHGWGCEEVGQDVPYIDRTYCQGGIGYWEDCSYSGVDLPDIYTAKVTARRIDLGVRPPIYVSFVSFSYEGEDYLYPAISVNPSVGAATIVDVGLLAAERVDEPEDLAGWAFGPNASTPGPIGVVGEETFSSINALNGSADPIFSFVSIGAPTGSMGFVVSYTFPQNLRDWME